MNEQERGHRYSLGAIVAGAPTTTGEKIKAGIRNAPFWVIAVMAHVIIAAVLGLLYFKSTKPPVAHEEVIRSGFAEPEPLKLDEKATAPDDIDRSPIPKDLRAEASRDSFDPLAATEVLNEEASKDGPKGIVDGDNPDATDISTSKTGIGRAGAIGLGSGSGPGGGARRGSPFGGSPGKWFTPQSAKPKIIETIDGGLKWLMKHQSKDGRWDCSNFASNCDSKLGPPCTGRGSATFDVGVSGLALLAFLGAGYDGRETRNLDATFGGNYGLTVREGLKFLKSSQDAEGCFGGRSDSRFTYAHAVATLAMCEAAQSTNLRPWKESAQAGLDFISKCQNPYKAWRYGARPGDNDVSVTGWMLMALKAGKDAGLTVSDSAMKAGIEFIDQMTDEDTGRTGYTKKGEASVRPEGLQNKFPGTETEALTAVGMCSRIFCGAAEKNERAMKAGAELLSKRLPVWNEASGSIDMYYWYYGSLAMFQIGGSQWVAWEKNMRTTVADSQLKGKDCNCGSWDTKDPWCDDGGRVYSTAIMTLCIEVYCRYPKVFGVGGKK